MNILLIYVRFLVSLPFSVVAACLDVAGSCSLRYGVSLLHFLCTVTSFIVSLMHMCNSLSLSRALSPSHALPLSQIAVWLEIL